MIEPKRINLDEFNDEDIARFRGKYRASEGCWEWNGNMDSRGYGVFKLNGKMLMAHRVSLALAGTDVAGKLVCHHCDNPKCVNPGHLFLGTHKDNTDDMLSKGRDRRRVVIPEKTITAIRMMRAMGSTIAEICRWSGLSETYVKKVVTRKRGRGDYHARKVCLA